MMDLIQQLDKQQKKILDEIFMMQDLLSNLREQIQPHDTGHIHTAISVVTDELNKKKKVLGITDA